MWFKLHLLGSNFFVFALSLPRFSPTSVFCITPSEWSIWEVDVELNQFVLLSSDKIFRRFEFVVRGLKKVLDYSLNHVICSIHYYVFIRITVYVSMNLSWSCCFFLSEITMFGVLLFKIVAILYVFVHCISILTWYFKSRAVWFVKTFYCASLLFLLTKLHLLLLQRSPLLHLIQHNQWIKIGL